MLLVIVLPFNLVKLVKLNQFVNVVKIVSVVPPVPVLMESDIMNKVQALFVSRRFWVAVAGVAFVALDGAGLGLTEDQITNVFIVGASWIVGDSIRAA
tara:strand:- start:266 stop:559 length:294 start_codon:yes stop_codon:yes gene_type:complete